MTGVVGEEICREDSREDRADGIRERYVDQRAEPGPRSTSRPSGRPQAPVAAAAAMWST